MFHDTVNPAACGRCRDSQRAAAGSAATAARAPARLGQGTSGPSRAAAPDAQHATAAAPQVDFKYVRSEQEMVNLMTALSGTCSARSAC